MGDNKEKQCYFVISPNPEHGNYIHVEEKVKTKDGEKDRTGALHYIKFGDEKEYLSEVNSYNRANPSIWFSCIEVKKLEKKDHENDLGKYFQSKLLKEKLPLMAERSKEWHLCFSKTKELQDITKDLAKNFIEVETEGGHVNIVKFDDDKAALKWFEEKLKDFES